ncbi:MAG: glycosyltransferase [Candidatus Omnitrophota bacterium]
MNCESAMVSIIMPVYNARAFIAESIESVLGQSYGHWELIIVDDCSRDDTVRIARRYEDVDSRVRVVTLTQNSGRPAVARNHGLRLASGQYAAFLDADDLWNPGKLKRQVEFFQDKPGKALVFGKFRVMCNDPRFDGKEIGPSKGINWEKSVYERLLKYDFIVNSSVMIDLTNIAQEEHFFDEDPKLAFVEDWDLWLRIARNGLFGYIPETSGIYRMHGANFSLGPARLDRAMAVVDKHVAKGFVDHVAADRARANILFTVAWSIVDQDASKAGKLFGKAMRLAKVFSKIYLMNALGRFLALFPGVCVWMKQNSIDRKVGKLFFNHQDL